MQRGSREEAGHEQLTYINLTPLLDVTFTILIIFMLIAPIIEQGINVRLPEASPRALEEQAPKELVVSVKKRGEKPSLYLGNIRVTEEDLAKKLKEAANANPEVSVTLKADKGLPYGMVVEVLDQISQAGITRLGMATVAKAKKK